MVWPNSRLLLWSNMVRLGIMLVMMVDLLQISQGKLHHSFMTLNMKVIRKQSLPNLFGPANPFFLGISITECLDLVKGAIDRAGYNGRIKMAIDVGATDFCIGKCNARNLNILQVVGDDLLMSNPKRIERAVNEYTCNALLLKVAC
ncbi:hypothetical protein BHM03_00032384 [Ensete ventricosum]|nr:hypothetical protein BHM03_00032384 [Ensete ventricosum]